ncbi:hypothetical protein EVAR_51296_1 [Eumeta japonica]|uniref:Uncharacterized protein n=1 Tax=Eumeta variegata TaxID=151549 RepID=A0A4C1XV76_EUMVA|nr:hypothetical protein EVAR_51296_1 [Eumeta japonica]
MRTHRQPLKAGRATSNQIGRWAAAAPARRAAAQQVTRSLQKSTERNSWPTFDLVTDKALVYIRVLVKETSGDNTRFPFHPRRGPL